MKRRESLATAITLIVMAGTLGFVIARKAAVPSDARSESVPRDTVYAMLDAARAGDTRAYLALYTGQMQAALKQTVTEKGDAAFKSYLRTTNAEIKGVAVEEPKTVSGNEMRVRVEYVYQDRNEAQTVFLEKRPEGWKIARVDSAERIRTLVPYGTPVQ
jgi:hypothetical protein